MDIAQALFQVVIDFFSLLFSLTHSRGRLTTENLFLRKQLAMYQERGIKPDRIDTATRITLVALVGSNNSTPLFPLMDTA
jgi:hypothetical protein